DYWRNTPSKLRPGDNALGARREYLDTARGCSDPWLHRLGCARAIDRGEESAYPTVGRGRRPRPFKKTHAEGQRVVEEWLLKKGGRATPDEYVQFCSSNFIDGKKQSKSVRKLLKLQLVQMGSGANGHGTKCYVYCLPGREPDLSERLQLAPSLRK